jgi:hypothetical protein
MSAKSADNFGINSTVNRHVYTRRSVYCSLVGCTRAQSNNQDMALNPEAQVGFAKDRYCGPTNKNASLSDDLANKVIYGEEKVKALPFVDRERISTVRNVWIDRWNKEIVPLLKKQSAHSLESGRDKIGGPPYLFLGASSLQKEESPVTPCELPCSNIHVPHLDVRLYVRQCRFKDIFFPIGGNFKTGDDFFSAANLYIVLRISVVRRRKG